MTSGTTTGPGNPTLMRGIGQTFNADNQLTSTGMNSGFGYDGNGNLTEYKGYALTFDPENRMTSYGTAEANGYNANGLRAWTEGSNGAKTHFLYDDYDEAVCELNTSGAVTATNTLGDNGLVSRHIASGSIFYDFDLSGNVSERLTSTGAMASADVTDAFGARQTTDTTHDPFGFSGQYGGYTDTVTGLVLLEHRFYDPSMGRWVTRDPIGYDGGVNLYGYCGNDPIDRKDITGWFCMDKFLQCVHKKALGLDWAAGCFGGLTDAEIALIIGALIACASVNVEDGESLLMPCIYVGLRRFSFAVGLLGCEGGFLKAFANDVALCYDQAQNSNGL